MNLTNKTVLITGANSGIGKACAEACAKAGASLILTGRKRDALEAVAKQLAPAPVHLCLFDVRDKAAVFSAIESLPEAFRKIDVLVNNAGLALGLEPVPNTNLDDWETMIDTNIKGMLYCTMATVPIMQKHGSGHIVNIGSTAGNYPYFGGNVYCATKSFVKQFSLCLRADFLGQHIRVTNIEPGMVETEFSNTRFKGDNARADSVYEGLEPMHAEDIADAVLWAITRPTHLNINRMELMPVMQAPGGPNVHRSK